MPLYEILTNLYDSNGFDIKKLEITFPFMNYSDFDTDIIINHLTSSNTNAGSLIHVTSTGDMILFIKDKELTLPQNITDAFSKMFRNYFNEYIPNFLSISYAEKTEILNKLSDDFFEYIKIQNDKRLDDDKYMPISFIDYCKSIYLDNSNYYVNNSKSSYLFNYYLNTETNIFKIFFALPLYINIIYDEKCIAKEYFIFHLC